MLSQGDTRHDQCGQDAQPPNVTANSCTDSRHSCLNDHSHISHMLDHLGHSLDHRDNTLLSPMEPEVWKEIAGLNLSRQQIREHNSGIGWQQWITLKGIVYDTTSFKKHFIAYNKKKAAENASQQSSDCLAEDTAAHHQEDDDDCKSGHCNSAVDDLLHGNNVDRHQTDRNRGTEDVSGDDVGDEDVSGDDVEDEDVSGDDVEDEDGSGDDFEVEDGEWEDYEDDVSSESSSSGGEYIWKYNVITTLQKTGLSMSEIETEIKPFKIGTLHNPALPRWKYWDSIRNDILAVCGDIKNKDGTDVGQYEQEYLALLQRWLCKYRDIDPVDKTTTGDGNRNVFFFTENPDNLRDWMKMLAPFDTELPDSGAWVSSELLLSPLGDTHDVFSAALRSHSSSADPFSHDIQGKVAWAELPQDVIKNDQMTPDQQLVHDSRLLLGDRVNDPTLMKKRRERLGSYFQKQHKFSEKKMGEYLQWAAVMEQNQRDLDALCHSQDDR
ncbi:hypothetical protein ACOMHN_066905 [Nucella lapillus]